MSLTQRQADAGQLLALVQATWRIENRLHLRRDVTLGEDGCQVCVQVPPQAFAAFNGAVLALMDW